MADTTIEWTRITHDDGTVTAGKVWNPVRGCALVSHGCTNCYAMRQAHRFSGPGQPYHGLTKMTSHGPVWTGRARTVPEKLMEPLGWKKPHRIFVNSMSDLFHEDVPFDFVDAVFGVMLLTPQHTYQLLTKRPERMREYIMGASIARPIAAIAHMARPLVDTRWPPRHVWLGVSTEDQETADKRIPVLLDTPAAVRWISAEPLLGPIVLRREVSSRTGFTPCGPETWHERDYLTGWDGFRDHKGHRVGYMRERLDWVVVGGESGPGARPMHPDWARSLRDQCVAAGVPFMFKQNGAYVSVSEVAGSGAHHQFPDGATVRRVGKHAAGRTLDGRLWDQYPQARGAT